MPAKEFKKYRFCFCRFPDDHWLSDTDPDDIEMRNFDQETFLVWNKNAPDKKYYATISCMQNLVLDGPTCLDFELVDED